MIFKLGLTGSMGMGKTSTALLFQKHNCGVWDADKAVHRLYSKGGAAVEPIKKHFPGAVKGDTVSREELKKILKKDFSQMNTLESIVHPLVSADRNHFINTTKFKINVFDIPLLFETGTHKLMDKVACVYVSKAIQMNRIKSRKTMEEIEIKRILDQQMPIEEKSKLADFVIETFNKRDTEKQVLNVIKKIESDLNA